MTIFSRISFQAVRSGFNWWIHLATPWRCEVAPFENQTREQNQTGLKRRKIRKYELDFMSLFFAFWRN